MSEEKAEILKNNKRVWITILLLASCLTAAALLWGRQGVPARSLASTAQLDSLIIQTLDLHGVASEQVRQSEITLDSTFTRRVYSVTVPFDFSKTTYHYDLHSVLLPYSATTVGKVQFPEKNIAIQILYNSRVLRTVHLRTDPLLDQSP